jgi:hypothetical protein
LSVPGSTDAEPDSGYLRLEQQIRWYDSKSGSAQAWFKWTKILEFICAAAVPPIALLHGPTAAVLSAVVIVLEGLQHMNQWQHNWITYRSTCEMLRHEKYSYLARSGQYASLTDDEAKGLLVENVEAMVSTEHAKWVSRQQAANRKLPVLGTTSRRP